MSASRTQRPANWLRRVVMLIALLALIFTALASWLMATESGLRTVLSVTQRYLPLLEIQNPHGTLTNNLRIERIQYRLPERTIEINNFVFDWSIGALLRRELNIKRLHAQSIVISSSGQTPADNDNPSEAINTPDAFRLPLRINVAELSVDELRLHDTLKDTTQVLAQQFATRLQSDGSLHQVQQSRVKLPFMSGQATLDGEIKTAQTPYQAKLSASLDGQLKHAGRAHLFNSRLQSAGALNALKVDFDLTEGARTARLQAVVDAFAAMPLQNIHVQFNAFDPAQYLPQTPQANLSLQLQLQQNPPAKPESKWQLSGQLSIINHLARPFSQQGVPLERLDSQLIVQADRIALDQLDIHLPHQGRLGGQIEFAEQRLQANLKARNIHPRAFDAALPDTAVDGSLVASGDQNQQTGKLEINAGTAHLQAEGEFHSADNSAARFALHGKLHQINPALFHRSAPVGQLNSRFQASGTLSEKTQIEASWQFLPSTLKGKKLNGKGDIRLEDGRLAHSDVELMLGRNKLYLQGNWDGSESSTSDLQLKLDAPQLAAFDLSQIGIGGSAQVKARLRGSLQAPQLDLNLNAESLKLPAALTLDKLHAKGQLNWRADSQEDAPLALTVELDALKQQQTTVLQQAALKLDGSLNAHQFNLQAQQNAQQKLQLKLKGALHRKSADPYWQGQLSDLQINSAFFNAELQQAAPLKLAANQFDLGAAQLKIGQQGELKLQRTLWQSDGRIEAKGTLRKLRPVLMLRTAQAGQNKTATTQVNADNELQIGGEWDLLLDQKASGQLRLYRESGDLILPGSDHALGIQTLTVDLQAQSKALKLNIDASGKTFGSLQAQAHSQLERTAEGGWRLAGDRPIKASADLNTPDLSWLARLLPEQILSIAGQLKAHLDIGGKLDAPQFDGHIEAQQLAFDMPEQGLKLSGGSLQARFDRDSIQIERLHFKSPNTVRPNAPKVPVDVFTQTPGELNAHGEIALSGGSGRFQFEAQRLPILQRADRWLILSGKGKADSGANNFNIDARFTVDSGYIELADTPAPSLSEDVVTTQQLQLAEQQKAQAQNANSQIEANIQIDLGKELHLSALGLKTRLGGALNLRQHGKQALLAIGTISTQGGVYRGYGQDLTLERGLINFQGPLDNPGLNILAMRTGLAVEAGVEVLGSARRPIIKLVSRPQVADIEKLSWIVLGRAPRGGASDSAMLASAAQSIFGGSSEGGTSDQIKKGLGLDEFGIGGGEMGSARRAQTSRVVADGSVVTNSGNSSMQALTIGKRLSDKLTFSFEKSLSDAQALAKLSYQVSRHFSLVLRSGENNSADLYYTFSFR